MKKATMTDIAVKAEVSQATVSRVINNHPNVNEEVRQRVQAAIKELGYIPNKAAQTLKNQNSNILGVSITDINNPYFAELTAEIEKEARRLGYSIILHNTGYNPLTEKNNLDQFISRQVDGIIYVPVSDYNYEKVRKLPVPVVSTTLYTQDLDSVHLNHPQGGALAASHFIRQGHTKFAVFSEVDCRKTKGFLNELYSQGMNVNKDNYIEITEVPSTIYSLREYVNNYFEKNPHPDFTAVFCGTDAAAFDFMQVAQEHGLRVPEDIAVIGFDDTIIAKINRITSIHQPLEEMARNSLEIIIDKINNPQQQREPVDIKLTPTLIVRESSDYKVTKL